MARDGSRAPSPGWCDRFVAEAVDKTVRAKQEAPERSSAEDPSDHPVPLGDRCRCTTAVAGRPLSLRGTSPPRRRRGVSYLR